MKKSLPNIIALLLGFGLLLVLMAIVEIAVREAWTPPWQKNAFGSIDPQVFAEYAEPKPAGQPFNGKYVRLNSYGFRHDKEFSFVRDKNTYRILLIGGSVAYGAWASSRAKTVMGILEQCLHHPQKKVEVIGLGESGDEVADEAFWLFKLGLRLQPDLVIALSGYNDLFYSALEPKLWDKGSGRSGYARPGAQSPLRENTWQSVKKAFGQLVFAGDRYLYHRLHSYRFLKYKLGLEVHEDSTVGHDERMAAVGYQSESARESSEMIVADYSYIKLLLDGLNIPLMIFFQPVKGCGANADASKYPRDSALCSAFRTAASARSDLGISDLGLKISDKLEAQGSFMDPVHLDDAGFAVLGKAMCDEIGKKMAPLLSVR